MPIQELSKNKKKILKSLRLRKQRDSNQLFIIEGKKFVTDIYSRYPERIDCLISFEETILTQFELESLFLADEVDYRDLSQLQQPTQLMAVIRMPSLLSKLSQEFVLVADKIQDPGNLGTIIRTALWFGVKEVLLIKGSVDLYNAKVVQSTAGAILDMKFMQIDQQEAIHALKSYQCFMLDMSGQDIQTVAISQNQKYALIVGNEGNGLSDWGKLENQSLIAIPANSSDRTIDSLNAGISAGIAMYALSQIMGGR